MSNTIYNWIKQIRLLKNTNAKSHSAKPYKHDIYPRLTDLDFVTKRVWEELERLDANTSRIFCEGVDTYTADETPSFKVNDEDRILIAKFEIANTGAATLNLDGIGAVNITKHDGFGNIVPLVSGDIFPNADYLLTWDGTQYIIVNLGGGIALITDTYVNINALRIAKLLAQGGLYFISDRNWLLQATDSGNFSLQGSLLARNPDHQNTGSYIAVAATQNEGIWENTWNVPYTGASGTLILGETVTDGTTSGAGIVIADSGTALTVVNVIGTFAHTNIVTGATFSATIGAATQTTSYGLIPAKKIVIWNNQHWENQTGNHGANTPDLDGVNWTLLDPETKGNGYITEVDFVEVDFPNDWLQRRTDKRDNDISYSKATDDFSGGLYGSTAVDFFKWGSDTSVANSTEAGVIDNRNVLGTIADCNLEFFAILTNLYLDSTAQIFGNSMQIASKITEIVMINGSKIRLNVMHPSSETVTLFLDGSVVGSNVFPTHSRFNKKVLISAEFEINHIGYDLDFQQTITSNVKHKRVEQGFSNFEESIASASSIDLLTLEVSHAGIIVLTGNTTVTDIVNMPDNHPVTFRAENGNLITFTHTDLGSATTTSIAMKKGVDLTITGRVNESDSIIIHREGDRNKEIHSVLVSDKENFITLVDALIIDWDLSLGKTAVVTLGGAPRILAITNPTNGMFGLIKVIQDGSGNWLLGLPGNSKTVDGGGGALALSSGAGEIDILTFVYDGTDFLWNIGRDYS